MKSDENAIDLNSQACQTCELSNLFRNDPRELVARELSTWSEYMPEVRQQQEIVQFY